MVLFRFDNIYSSSISRPSPCSCLFKLACCLSSSSRFASKFNLFPFPFPPSPAPHCAQPPAYPNQNKPNQTKPNQLSSHTPQHTTEAHLLCSALLYSPLPPYQKKKKKRETSIRTETRTETYNEITYSNISMILYT